MEIHRTGPGTYRMTVDDDTAQLIARLCDDLDALLDTDSPLLARLFPPPYGDDDERNQGYSALAVPELIEHRRNSIDMVRLTLSGGDLDAAQLSAWMRAVNDLRLVLAAVLGIDSDEDDHDVPRELEDTDTVYHWLGALLELVVSLLAEDLPDRPG